MTMEDITLNLYIPENPKEQLKTKSGNKKLSRTIDPKKDAIGEKPVMKKHKSKADGKASIGTDVIDFGEKPQKRLKSQTNFLKNSENVLKKLKIKDKTRKDKNVINNIYLESKDDQEYLAVQKDEVFDGVVNDVEPIIEPVFSAKTFESVTALHPHLVSNLAQLFNITTMTIVQQITIPVLMSRKDALIRSQTGSGKTLAYALPILNFLQSVKPKISRSDGVKTLIILPTRELALQTFECFQKLVRAFTWLVPGLLVGGEKRKSEKARLRKGINILIGTPGRLLDHAKRTAALSLQNIQWLVLDEADKLLDLGYEEAISSLLEAIREQVGSENTVQTVLLSATLTPGVEKLAGLALDSPIRLDASADAINTDDHLDDTSAPFVIPNTLAQKYIVVPAKLRLVLLAATIIYHCQLEKTGKVLIFMATQDMVNFYTDLLNGLAMKKVLFFKLHGNMTQIERTEVFKKFRSAISGVLLCTDVGARGLDLPSTEVIIQFNAPINPTDYVHRVGRTARVGSSGISILFLDPSEMNFLQWLSEKRIKLQEQNTETYLEGLLEIDIGVESSKKRHVGIEEAASALQFQFENILLEDKDFHEIACQAYKSWVRFYASYPKESRTVFCFKKLHLGHHAKSFALRDPPSKIGGIGKPTYLKRDKFSKKSKKKEEKLKLNTASDRTKRLINSEFDSGIKFKRKKV